MEWLVWMNLLAMVIYWAFWLGVGALLWWTFPRITRPSPAGIRRVKEAAARVRRAAYRLSLITAEDRQDAAEQASILAFEDEWEHALADLDAAIQDALCDAK